MESGLPATRIEKIAAELIGDMRQRGLRPGDRYFTAVEASELFSVSSMMMHRAMQSLAKREILVRRRNQGTFVGPKFRNSNHRRHQIDVLHILVSMDFHITQDYSSDALVDEYVKALPGVTVEVHHMHEPAATNYVAGILERIGDSRREGLVLIRCSRDIQLAVSDSGVPAVIFGHVYPGVSIHYIDHDQKVVGELLAGYAIENGCRRFALLTHARWRYGDHLMIDSLSRVLAEAGVGLDDVKMRSVVPERETIVDVVHGEFSGGEPPDAFLCRTDFYAGIVYGVIDSLRSSIERAPLIASGGHSPPSDPRPYARVISRMSLAEKVDHTARLLIDAAEGRNDPDSAVIIPVEFQKPMPQ